MDLKNIGEYQEDVEKGDIEESQLSQSEQPRIGSAEAINAPPPDYMSRSTASLFICFLFGIFAYRASNQARRFNRMKAYDEAAYFSNLAVKHNQSALACFVVSAFLFGIPFVISLATQGSISKYPSAREFFG